MSLVLRHLINSPSNLHGRRQPSNRSDGSLSSKRGGGLRLRWCRSSPSPKGHRGAITHPFSLTYVWEILSHCTCGFAEITPYAQRNCLKTFLILSLRWVFLLNFWRSEIWAFLFFSYGGIHFSFRQDPIVSSYDLTDFSKVYLFHAYGNSKFARFWFFCMDGVRFRVGQIWSQNPLSASSERKQRVKSPNSPPKIHR